MDIYHERMIHNGIIIIDHVLLCQSEHSSELKIMVTSKHIIDRYTCMANEVS